MNSSQDLTILVNSTDSFEDCWMPFFTLFKIYWPDCPFEIVLNTEHKDYQHSGLNIRASKVAKPSEQGKRIPWDECLRRCLEGITTPYVLYFQEDYFVDSPVDAEFIRDAVMQMKTYCLDHIRLMQVDESEIGKVWEHDTRFSFVKKTATFRVSLQVGLWARKSLLAILDHGESGWSFEWNATLRSFDRDDLYLCVPPKSPLFESGYAISYPATGIIKGKWFVALISQLFSKHEISVDFERRGVYRLDTKETSRVLLRRYLRKLFIFSLACSGPLRRLYGHFRPYKTI